MSPAYLLPKVKSKIPQKEPLDRTQVQNQAGGYVYALDKWKALERFLILGAEGATYYASQEKQVALNSANLDACVAENPAKVALLVRDMVNERRAPKQDPLLFALAKTKEWGYRVLPEVAKTGTHLFHYMAMAKAERGTGSGFRKALARWYALKSDRDVVYDAIKYQSRDGWSHRDVLRLAHPKVVGRRNDIFHWIVKGWPSVGAEPHQDEVLGRIWAFEQMKLTTDEAEAVELIRKYDLPRECVKTEWLNSPKVWEALLERMPMTAMIRNLGKMTQVGLLKPLTPAVAKVCAGLEDKEWIRKAHVHPLQLLAAIITYGRGKGFKGSNTWQPVEAVNGALDKAFYDAFDYLEPTGKRFYLGVDVSPSMFSGEVVGIPGLTPGAAAACLALCIAKAEKPNYVVRMFSGGGNTSWPSRYDTSSLIPLDINDRSTFGQAMQAVSNRPWGGTDCALPMIDAKRNNLLVDCFVVITDNETHSGTMHPMEALRQYRAHSGVGAKLIVIGMTATKFSIADPRDPGCLDIAGFDTTAPRLIADFACGRV